MNSLARSLVFASFATVGACTAVQAQSQNIVKLGASRYTTHSSTSGINGIGVPAGADATTSDATTVILTYERLLTPNLGAELVLGIPPRIKAKATGSIAFLGDDVLSARNATPTLFLNYHFGAPGDVWRPYFGAGWNYTRFVGVRSSLAPDVKMSDSNGWAAQAGIAYALSPQWGVFASVARLDVKSKIVASGSTVLTTTVDFKPVVYSFGASYEF